MKVQIDKPCNEDWNSMKIGLVSRHCDSCEKAVFDFTDKTKEEILTFLIQNQNKSVCGRFKKSQIDFHHEELEVIIEGLKTQKNNKYAFAILSLACLAMASCSDDDIDNNSALGELKADTTINQLIDTTQGLSSFSDTLPTCETEKRKHQKGLALDFESKKHFDGDVIEDLITVGIVIPPDEMKGSDEILTLVEVMPEFPGGMDSLFSFLGANIVYPKWEKKNNIQGKVYVNFVIEKDGAVNDIKILRSVEGSKNFDAEVIRVMKLMPKWIPGKQKGEVVAVQYNLAIKFSLKD